MTIELLISVRSWDEYETLTSVLAQRSVKQRPLNPQSSNQSTSAASVIIDFKEPDAGPLAPTLPELWKRVANDAVKEDSPQQTLALQPTRLSAALGDADSAIRLAAEVPSEFSFAKMGPEGIADPDTLARQWADVANQLSESVSLVPVAYADHQNAGSPTIMQTIQQCVGNGYTRLLIDTFDKTGPSSIESLRAAFGHNEDWQTIRQRIRGAGIWLSLAGRIDLSMADRLAQGDSLVPQNTLAPECIGVRGAVCDGPRSGLLSAARLANWLDWQQSLPLSEQGLPAAKDGYPIGTTVASVKA